MALFGVNECNPLINCTNAVAAALQMTRSLEQIKQYLKKHFDESFKIGIGIHFGSAVLGNIGHREKIQYIAIGDTVNIASRIEQQTKDANTSILISESTYTLVQDKVRIGQILKTRLKGKKGVFKLYEILAFI